MNVGTAVCLNASLIDASQGVSYEATAVWSETGDEVLREHLSECPPPIPIDKVMKAYLPTSNFTWIGLKCARPLKRNKN